MIKRVKKSMESRKKNIERKGKQIKKNKMCEGIKDKTCRRRKKKRGMEDKGRWRDRNNRKR